jgi:hypothetical protein
LHPEKRRVSQSAKIAKKEYVREKGKGKELGSVELVCLVSQQLIPQLARSAAKGSIKKNQHNLLSTPLLNISEKFKRKFTPCNTHKPHSTKQSTFNLLWIIQRKISTYDSTNNLLQNNNKNTHCVKTQKMHGEREIVPASRMERESLRRSFHTDLSKTQLFTRLMGKPLPVARDFLRRSEKETGVYVG